MTEPQYFGIDYAQTEARIAIAMRRACGGLDSFSRAVRRAGEHIARMGFASAILGDAIRPHAERCWNWRKLLHDYPIRKERRVRADFHARTRAIRRTERRQARRERRAARQRCAAS